MRSLQNGKFMNNHNIIQYKEIGDEKVNPSPIIVFL